ncbi:MAG TPA: hypothetical protein VMH04_19770 [Candidatus Solibacter sp.]|nr:hypothetical protein [Candidatus Solibacter sp.]
MSELEKITLYSIHRVAQHFLDDERFDDSLLPATIVPDVTLEKIPKGLLTREAFSIFKNHIAAKTIESFEEISYAIVHRFRGDFGTGEAETQSMFLVRTLSALLRIIRPMRQRFFAIQGVVKPDGKFEVGPFDSPEDYVELPEAHKLFYLRNQDLLTFQRLAGSFLRVMNTDYWPIRLAVQFHDLGYYTFQRYWKLSWFSWIAGIESLCTENDDEHSGQLVIKERLKRLLGADAVVYEPGDVPSFLTQPEQTVAGVVDPIYELRNYVMHGQRVPSSFYTQDGRQGVDGKLRKVEELVEALSFLLRKSIQLAIEPNLVESFRDDGSRRAYFFPLTKTRLLRRRDILNFLKEQTSSVTLNEILLALNPRQALRAPKPFNLDQVREWVTDAVSTGQIVRDARGGHKTA